MQLQLLSAVLSVAVVCSCQEVPKPAADGRYTISAPGIRAQVQYYKHPSPSQAVTIANLTPVHPLRSNTDQSLRERQEREGGGRSAGIRRRSLLPFVRRPPLILQRSIPANVEETQQRTPATPHTTPSPADTPTGSEKASSPSTARRSARRRTTARTRCTAGRTTGRIGCGTLSPCLPTPSPSRSWIRKATQRGCRDGSTRM